MSDLEDRFRAAVLGCDDTVAWHKRVTLADTFTDLARASEELGLDEWDVHGGKGPVERLEREVAAWYAGFVS